jgi:hypothetical protein
VHSFTVVAGFTDGYCSSTAGTEVNPWLYIDLGGSDYVFSLQITAREDTGTLA